MGLGRHRGPPAAGSYSVTPGVLGGPWRVSSGMVPHRAHFLAPTPGLDLRTASSQNGAKMKECIGNQGTKAGLHPASTLCSRAQRQPLLHHVPPSEAAQVAGDWEQWPLANSQRGPLACRQPGLSEVGPCLVKLRWPPAETQLSGVQTPDPQQQ